MGQKQSTQILGKGQNSTAPDLDESESETEAHSTLGCNISSAACPSRVLMRSSATLRFKMAPGDCIYIEPLHLVMQAAKGGHKITRDSSNLDPSFGEMLFASCRPDALPSPLKLSNEYNRNRSMAFVLF